MIFVKNIIQKSLLFLILLVLGSFSLKGQTAIIKGSVVDAKNNEGISFVNVFIQNTTIGTTTDLEGNFILSALEPGLYNLEASFIGYSSSTIENNMILQLLLLNGYLNIEDIQFF